MKSLISVCILLLGFFCAVGQSPDKPSSADVVTVKAIPHRCILLDSPSEFKVLSDNSISITAGKETDIHNPADGSYFRNNVPKFLFTPDTNFEFSARLKPGFNNLYDGGAILVYSDTENWAKILIQYTKDKKTLLGVSVVKNKITDDSYVNITDVEIYLRLTKKGKVFAFYFSVDGKQWTLAREFIYSKPDQMKIGFYVQSPVGQGCTVEFADISYLKTQP